MKYTNKRSLKSAAKKKNQDWRKRAREEQGITQADKGKVTAILHTASLSSSFSR
ncbi:hypothetical protein PAHAL_8G251600 [Panicum hallii]|jgi:hypothetical protein|uniref:Uncharacterized protein n=1 Tax=Panicum hallii TaxID=206008 RepID=A0A2T8IA69_9POAL|nr:hypothetical protein PAHAL_8G251600 [Panicum hallii]